jgi:NAD(P)-dependent dehydrogenase (short-subunit alcohol dehydrogenase family)
VFALLDKGELKEMSDREESTIGREFTGRRYVVTGAASGMGLAVTHALTDAGASVFAVDRDEIGLANLREDHSASHLIETCVADLSVEADIEKYAGLAIAAFGEIDGLFNNAGIAGFYRSIPQLTASEWRKVMAINVDALFLALKYLSPAIVDGGAVVNTSSTLGLVAEPDRIDYVVSKHAVIGITKAAAVEFASRGIRVNAICPGPIDTPMMASYEKLLDSQRPEQERQRIERSLPVGRYGRPDEIARLVTFLLAPGLEYLTGAVVTIDGGFTSM